LRHTNGAFAASLHPLAEKVFQNWGRCKSAPAPTRSVRTALKLFIEKWLAPFPVFNNRKCMPGSFALHHGIPSTLVEPQFSDRCIELQTMGALGDRRRP
jgi:hypothetical protein